MTSGRARRTLIADPDYFGSLTAVRDLGRSGHQVAVADLRAAASRSGASRYCTRRMVAPAELAHDGVVDWLVRVGTEWPGAFLYPSSDDMAWRIAGAQDVLRQVFLLHQPAASATIGLLDKSQLYAHAEACGVPYPQTHCPVSMAEVRELGAVLTRTQAFPVIVKPRTQAGGLRGKGYLTQTAAELVRHVDELRRQGAFAPHFVQAAPADITWPLVQRFLPEAAVRTYSLSGYVDEQGIVRTARASTKVFQIPVRVGIGIAFEGRAVRAEQVAAIEALARASGYFGAFEAEFIHGDDGTYYLMDFNPRYYGQMNFEVSRGMRLPSIVHAAALGDAATVQQLVAESDARLRTEDAGLERFCDRSLFRTLLRTQHLSGRLNADERARWMAWMDTGELSDFVLADDDPQPARVDRTKNWRRWMRHPRSSYRMLFQ